MSLLCDVRSSYLQSSLHASVPDEVGSLEGLAASLRAGTSLIQAVDGVAADASPPTNEEFRRVMTEQWLGRDLVTALADIAARMRSPDFAWAVGASEIHRAVGGGLADVLDRVADTIRTRNRVRGQVQVLTAEGRLSAWILGGLPPAMLLTISLLNPAYVRELTGHLAGLVMLGTASALLLLGLVWMRRIIRMEL
jgi:tight adherence protein B